MSAAAPASGARTVSGPRPVRVAPTRAGWRLLVLAAALLGAGWGLRLVLLRDAGLLLACVLAVALLWALLAGLLTGSRAVVDGAWEVRAGVPTRWSIRMGRRWLPALADVIVWEAGDRTSRVEARTGLVLGLASTERGVLRARLRERSLVEPLGLARARVPLRTGWTSLVLPRALSVPGLALGTGESEGRRPLDRETDRLDPHRLRDYRPGDPMTAISWRQSARTDRLVVVEREGTASGPTSVLADVGPAVLGSSEAVVARRAARETAIGIAAGLVEALCAEGREVSFALVTAPGEVRAVVASPGDPLPALRLLALADEPAAESLAPRSAAADSTVGRGRWDVVVLASGTGDDDAARLPLDASGPTGESYGAGAARAMAAPGGVVLLVGGAEHPDVPGEALVAPGGSRPGGRSWAPRAAGWVEGPRVLTVGAAPGPGAGAPPPGPGSGATGEPIRTGRRRGHGSGGRSPRVRS